MVVLREVVETRGLFCSLYSDRAGHFFVTPKRGERVDMSRPTQVGRALQELGVKMIAAYSPHGQAVEFQWKKVAGFNNEVCWANKELPVQQARPYLS
jgi:hypothetical protein